MRYILLALVVLICGCNSDATNNNNEGMELIYSGGATNLNTHIYKINVDSVAYLIIYRREGVAVIKHGSIK